METREAFATIKGYYYQFDTTILKLLDLQNDSDSVIVEGIEDIDIQTATDETTVQCKYLSKPRFINSAVREPIILMLEHFINTPSHLKYNLYAHFENETPGNEPIIDLPKLKEILTYSEDRVKKHYDIEKHITDVTLNAFLLQFKFQFGFEFHTQQQKVIEKLRTKFNCSAFEADTLYYNNALRVVIDKAIQRNISQREISKTEFIHSIDCSKRLFNEWFIRLRSKKEYFRLFAQDLKSTRTLEPSRAKYILIGKNILEADNSELPLSSFIESLIGKYYRLNSSLRDSKPLTFILDCDKSTLLNLKRALIDHELLFNDGYEEIKFSSQIFNKEPIINKSVNGAKIIKASYLLKIISKDTFIQNISHINSPSSFLIFSNENINNSFSCSQLFDIKYCDDLKDVHKLLNP